MPRKLSSPPRRHTCLGASCLFVIVALWLLVVDTSPRPGVTIFFEPIPTSPTTKPKNPQGIFIEPGLIKQDVAVIVDDRPLEAIVPLLLHFSSVLGRDWPIILFTSQDIIPESTAFHRAIDERRIAVAFLPPGVHISHQQDLFGLLTSTWFWESLAPAEHVFMFQADSIICANSPMTISEFLEYDFIGAPIDDLGGLGGGVGGGLSLRNRSLMLDIVRSIGKKDKKEHRHIDQVPMIELDDQWLFKRIKGLPARQSGQPGAKLPSAKVARTFAVESIWYEKPFGFHALESWGMEKVAAISKWCPELSLTRGAAFQVGA